MNFYGKQSTDQHTLTGRLIPIFEALWIVILRASGQPTPERRFSNAMPEWAHNLCAKLTTTIFKGLVKAAPRDNMVNAENYGCILGILLRAVVFYVKEVPAILEKEGLMNLSPEKEAKLEQFSGLPQLFSIASDFFQKPVTGGDKLVEIGAEKASQKAAEISAFYGQVVLYLLTRPVQEQSAFLEGIAKGFKSLLRDDGEFAGNKRRLDIYYALFANWPEIAEMQNEPHEATRIRTRLDLLKWLEKVEEMDFGDDPKAFFALCDEIGLDIGTPGHPTSLPLA